LLKAHPPAPGAQPQGSQGIATFILEKLAMSLTMYEASVPVFERMLANLSRILGKAEAHAIEKRLDSAVFLQARLYPDMFPLVRQIQTACDHAKGTTARLAGLEPPTFPDDERTFDEVSRRIARTLEFIGGVAPASFDNSAFRKIEIKIGSREMQFEARQYLLTFALPNFFFHVATAYDILRHSGLNIGKRDYLG
jgi:hypothetical protein